MKLDECNAMKNGDSVYFNLGNGWRQNATFVKMLKVTTFGRMTFSDLMNGKFNINSGKEVWNAMVKYVDERGRVTTTYISPRKLHRAL